MSDQFKNEMNDPQRAEFEESHPISNSTDLYQLGLKTFKEQGYLVEAAQEGIYCGHNIYEKSHPGIIDGLQIPDDFFMYKNLVFGGTGINTISNTISNWGYMGKKELYNFWSPIVSPSTRKDRSLYAVADMQIRSNCAMENGGGFLYNDLISINGVSGAKSFIPRKDWFSEEVQAVSYRDLLTILPRAEQEVLMLILGRIMVGRDGSVSIEGTEINHTFRSYGIMIGLEGGLGKSTLMNYIISALNFCGYVTEAIHDLSRPFGWGKIVRSHLAYIDDLTQSSQKRLITHYLTKQITSNGLISTEQKGIDPVSLKAKTVLLGCSNDYNPKDFYDMDAGMISRCHLLYTYRTIELDRLERTPFNQDSPDIRIRPHWEWIASKTNSSTLTLGCWLLAQAAEKFLRFTGYVETDQGWRKEGEDILEEKIKLFSSYLKIQSCKQDTAFLVRTIRFLWLCELLGRNTDLNESSSSQWGVAMVLALFKVIQAFSTNLNYAKLYEAMSADYVEQGRPSNHPFHSFTIINFESFDTSLAIALKRAEGDNSSAEVLKSLMNGIITVQGFKLVGEPYWFNRYWEEACIDDPYFIEVYNRVFKHLQGTLKGNVNSFFASLTIESNTKTKPDKPKSLSDDDIPF